MEPIPSTVVVLSYYLRVNKIPRYFSSEMPIFVYQESVLKLLRSPKTLGCFILENNISVTPESTDCKTAEHQQQLFCQIALKMSVKIK